MFNTSFTKNLHTRLLQLIGIKSKEKVSNSITDITKISIYIKIINDRIDFSNECFKYNESLMTSNITPEQYIILISQCRFENELDQLTKCVDLAHLYCSYNLTERFQSSLNLYDILSYVMQRLNQSFKEFTEVIKKHNTDPDLVSYKLGEVCERAIETYDTGFVIFKLTAEDPYHFIDILYHIKMKIETLQEIWIYNSDDAKRFKDILISTISKELEECQ